MPVTCHCHTSPPGDLLGSLLSVVGIKREYQPGGNHSPSFFWNNMPFGHSFPQRTFASNKVGTSMLDGLGMMLATKTTCVAASQPENFIKVGHRGIDFAKFERFDPCMTRWGIQVVVAVLWEAVMVGV